MIAIGYTAKLFPFPLYTGHRVSCYFWEPLAERIRTQIPKKPTKTLVTYQTSIDVFIGGDFKALRGRGSAQCCQCECNVIAVKSRLCTQEESYKRISVPPENDIPGLVLFITGLILQTMPIAQGWNYCTELSVVWISGTGHCHSYSTVYRWEKCVMRCVMRTWSAVYESRPEFILSADLSLQSKEFSTTFHSKPPFTVYMYCTQERQ